VNIQYYAESVFRVIIVLKSKPKYLRVSKHFIVPTAAHYYKITEMSKTI